MRTEPSGPLMPLPTVELCKTRCLMYPYCDCSEWVAAYRAQGWEVEAPKLREQQKPNDGR